MTQTTLPLDDGRFALAPGSATFRDSQLERSYRRAFLHRDRWQIVLAVVLLNVSNVVFIATDVDFTGGTATLRLLLGIRAGLLALSLALVWILWRDTSLRLVDGAVALWTTYVCVLSLFLATTRPPDYAPRVVGDAMVVLIIYILIPNRFLLQLFPALLLTVGTMIDVFTSMTLPPASLRVVVMAFVFMNIFGAWTSWHHHVDRRTRYALLVRERELRDALEKARHTRDVLEELLPICASCKSVRDDAGYWRKVEEYLTERTERDVTHGICPDCARRLYPEFPDLES